MSKSPQDYPSGRKRVDQSERSLMQQDDESVVPSLTQQKGKVVISVPDQRDNQSNELPEYEQGTIDNARTLLSIYRFMTKMLIGVFFITVIAMIALVTIMDSIGFRGLIANKLLDFNTVPGAATGIAVNGGPLLFIRTVFVYYRSTSKQLADYVEELRREELEQSEMEQQGRKELDVKEAIKQLKEIEELDLPEAVKDRLRQYIFECLP